MSSLLLIAGHTPAQEIRQMTHTSPYEPAGYGEYEPEERPYVDPDDQPNEDSVFLPALQYNVTREALSRYILTCGTHIRSGELSPQDTALERENMRAAREMMERIVLWRKS